MFAFIPLPWRIAPVALTALVIVLTGRIYIDNIREAGREAGIMEERQAWEDLRRRMIAQAAVKQAIAQRQIDDAERLRLSAETENRAALDHLHQIIAQQELDDAKSERACDCPPAISGSVRDALNAIGRGAR